MLTEKFIALTKKYSWRQIYFKIIIFSVSFIFIPILIVGGILIANNTAANEEQAKKARINSHNQIQNIWTDLMSSIYNIDSFVQNQSFSLSLTNFDIESLNSSTIDNINILTSMLKSTINMTPYINSVYVYNSDNNYVISTISSAPLKHFFDTQWISHLSDKTYFRTPVISGAETPYITIIKQFIEYDKCYCIYNISYNSVLSRLSSIDYAFSDIYILNQRDEVVFSKNSDDIGKKLQEIDKLNNMSKNEIISTNDMYNFKCITVSESKVHAPLSDLSLLTGLLMLLLIISGVFSTYIIISSFRKSLLGIVSKIADNGVSHDNKFDEIDFITTTVAGLIEKNTLFEEELAHQLSSLKKSQILALQGQINPHFIFNTINLIAMLDLSEEKNLHPISEITYLMADILRYLKTEEYLVSLKTELEYLEKYTELQNIKYESKISVIWNISEETKDLYIIKFSLQPIIENAIMHGFKDLDTDGNKITITAQNDGKYLYIDIHNNGKIIPPEKLDELNKQISRNTEIDNNHIGLLNVCLRYRLLFENEFKGHITSDITGTTVHFEFPEIHSDEI